MTRGQRSLLWAVAVILLFLAGHLYLDVHHNRFIAFYEDCFRSNTGVGRFPQTACADEANSRNSLVGTVDVLMNSLAFSGLLSRGGIFLLSLIGSVGTAFFAMKRR